jgi:hypothetical protein
LRLAGQPVAPRARRPQLPLELVQQMTVAIFACQISEVREDVGDDQDAAPAGAALAGLRSALEGKLSSELDAQVLVPHPAGNAQKGAL